MGSQSPDGEFFATLRQFIVHLVESRAPWYRQVIALLESYDLGTWPTFDTELRLHYLKELQKLLNMRDGLGLYLDGRNGRGDAESMEALRLALKKLEATLGAAV